MSKIKADTLSNLAGTAETDMLNAIHGSAKAWVNFTGTGVVAILAAYNVSSITDNTTGDYTINFAAALPDNNYVVALNLMSSVSAASISPHVMTIKRGTLASMMTAAACSIQGTYTGTDIAPPTAADMPTVVAAVFR